MINVSDKTSSFYKGNIESDIGQYFTSDIYNSFQETFLKSLKELKTHDDIYISEKIRLLASFKEITNLNTESINKVLGDKVFNEFQKQRDYIIKQLFPRQLTLILSYKCNLNCDFCFSDSLEKADPGRIDSKFFNYILDWMENKDYESVCLFGGEPTIHPEFLNFSRILKEKGYKVYFASNGLYGDDISKGLHSIDFLKTTFNIPCSDTISHRHKEIIEKNLNNFPNHINKSFRITIADDNKNFNFLEKLIQKYHPDDVSYALAFPANNNNNSFVNKEMIDTFLPEMKKITEMVNKYNVTSTLVKPIPLCNFSTEDIMFLLSNSNKLGLCDIYHDNYSQLTTVSPSGRLYPCISLPEMSSLNLNNKPNFEDIGKANKNLTEKLRSKPVLDKCKKCNLYNSYICQGFCLAYFL
jgi:radical SAM protein with 4Fe4S-binding SPASM domain